MIRYSEFKKTFSGDPARRVAGDCVVDYDYATVNVTTGWIKKNNCDKTMFRVSSFGDQYTWKWLEGGEDVPNAVMLLYFHARVEKLKECTRLKGLKQAEDARAILNEKIG